MRKLIVAVALVSLICALAISAWGAGEGLEISDVMVSPGETVYVTIKLVQPVMGTSVAISYTSDDNVLKPVESSSTWARKGALQDFDGYKKAGVWASLQAVELKGEICTLAFRIVSEEKHFDTKIVCTLKVKNGTADTADYTQEVWVSTDCRHDFGSWTNNGNDTHKSICRNCGRVQTQTHKWDDGTTVKDTSRENMEITTFRCEECGAKKVVNHVSSITPTAPEATEPEEPLATRPTLPTESNNNQSQTSPTTPSGDTQDDPQTTQPTQGSNGATVPPHDDGHGHATTPTKADDHDHGTTPTNDDHDHDHDHSDGNTINTVDSETGMKNALVLFGTIAVLIGAAVLLLKKKR